MPPIEPLRPTIRNASDDYITDVTEEALRSMSVSELIREAFIAGWKACDEYNDGMIDNS